MSIYDEKVQGRYSPREVWEYLYSNYDIPNMSLDELITNLTSLNNANPNFIPQIFDYMDKHVLKKNQDLLKEAMGVKNEV